MPIPRLYISRTPDGEGLPLPSYTSAHHVGLNLQAAISAPIRLNAMERVYVPVGFAVGIPQGYCGQVVSLPSLARQEGLIVLDAPQILNPADRRPLFVLLQNTSQKAFVLRRGIVCAQLIVLPVVQVCWKELEAPHFEGQTENSSIVLDTQNEGPKESLMTSSRRKPRSLRHRFQEDEEDE